MQTIPNEISGGRSRRIHSDEFKAQIVAACSLPGVSTAALAVAHGINANLARLWIQEAEGRAGGVPARTAMKSRAMAFVPVQLAAAAAASLPSKVPAPSLSPRSAYAALDAGWLERTDRRAADAAG